MQSSCKERCKNNLAYPIDDVITKLPRLWELKGFIHCGNCQIYVSREKYIHEIRCRCCNRKYQLKPRNTRKRRTITGEKQLVDQSNRFCLECGTKSTYIQFTEGRTPNYRWYKYLDGHLCNNCNAKRLYAIRRQMRVQEVMPIKIKIMVYNTINK